MPSSPQPTLHGGPALSKDPAAGSLALSDSTSGSQQRALRLWRAAQQHVDRQQAVLLCALPKPRRGTQNKQCVPQKWSRESSGLGPVSMAK